MSHLLPLLREDLQLSSAAPAYDGAPRWMLVDAITGRYFQLTMAALRLLRHWSLREPESVLRAANAEAGLPLSMTDLERLLRFLRAHDLIAGSDVEQYASYAGKRAARRHSWWRRLLHQYLFFRIPLWRPDPFLNRTWPVLARVGRPFLRYLMPLMLLLALFLVSQDWARYAHALPQLFNFEGMLMFALTMGLAKSVHELGHAYMARRAGCRVQSMGLAFMVMVPMLYTDVTDAWRVKERSSRLLISAGGILAEAILAVVALLAWMLLPEGIARSAALLLSSVTLVTTLLVNSNPLMRFDGYFLLSDYWQVDNLQERAFALCRWQLREWLFGYNASPPEIWSPKMRLRLLTWGYVSWIWRVGLFLGIALTVYHYFFKLLGVVLMAVEIGWFIALPVIRELIDGWKRRAQSRRSLRLRNGVVLTAVLLGVLLPWRSQLSIPALLEARQDSAIYAPVAARLKHAEIREGQMVHSGQLLLALEAPDLESRRHIVRQQITVLQAQLHRQMASRETAGHGLVLEQRLAEALAEYRGLHTQQRRLLIKAPHDGRVRDMELDLTPGRWVSAEQPLLHVVSAGYRLRGYASEEQLARVALGAPGVFISDDPTADAVPVRLEQLDPNGVRYLPLAPLASDRGGPIAVRRDVQQQAIPLQAQFGAEFAIEIASDRPVRPQRGVVLLEGPAESLLTSGWRRFWSLLIRESGF